jgi:hypothetical protein
LFCSHLNRNAAKGGLDAVDNVNGVK